MRFGSLLVLIFFLPTFAHAAPPSLTTYTLSHSTIYLGATSGSGLATTTSIDIAFSEQVKASIKIISAGGSTIKSLYSSSGVTNPTPKIWDGTNTADAIVGNGTYTILISATSTATDLTISDSSKTVIVASSDSTLIADEPIYESTTTTASSSSAPPEYLLIPTLRIITTGNRTVSAGADTTFSAIVYDGKGNKRDDSLISWSFGDGMQRTGTSIYHSYYYPGEYLVVVRANTADGGEVFAESIITVKDAGIKIVSISSRGISLMNRDTRTLDLSLWRLSVGGQEFKIPANTQILAGRTVLFPSQVIQLPMTGFASLLYPNGEIATTFPTQPSSAEVSYESVQVADLGVAQSRKTEQPVASEVKPIISAQTNIQAYDEAVIAPAAATELAAVGAVPESGIFRSPWFLSLIGVLTPVGSAFVFL